MPALRLYIDDRTFGSLLAQSQATGRTVEELAEAAISEAALKVEAQERAPHTRAMLAASVALIPEEAACG